MISSIPWEYSGTVEKTDWISVEEQDLPNKCPRYDIKPSNGKAAEVRINS